MVNDFIDEISNQEAILKAKDLSVFYGSLQAVNNVTFNIGSKHHNYHKFI